MDTRTAAAEPFSPGFFDLRRSKLPFITFQAFARLSDMDRSYCLDREPFTWRTRSGYLRDPTDIQGQKIPCKSFSMDCLPFSLSQYIYTGLSKKYYHQEQQLYAVAP